MLALGTMLDAAQVGTMLVMLGAGLMVMAAVADLVGSCVLVAVTIAVVGDVMVGAVESRPAALMLPAVVVQVTVEE